MNTSTGYRSEIRAGEIRDLAAKVVKENYRQYLRRLTLTRVRGFVDVEVSFDFPVTAVVGPNGGGKSTVLGAAALPYSSVPPGRFFAKSGTYDDSMQNWSIEYQLIERALNKRAPILRTASFKRLKWNRSAVDRAVLIFGVERTVPANERQNLRRAISGTYEAFREIQLPQQVAAEAEKVLGKPLSGFRQLYLDATDKLSMFSGVTARGDGYSEFHFGAGEASVIRIIAEVEAADEQSLILIEEIENGLHPVATQRMVEYLIGVAGRKKCQVVFTTHSNDALAPLPPEAIWAALGDTVIQGKLDVRALRAITGQVDARLVIFVEDEFAVSLVAMALRMHGGIEISTIQIHAMNGAGTAKQTTLHHNSVPTTRQPAVCFLDGDRSDDADPERRIHILPGSSDPEATIFMDVFGRLDALAAKLTRSLRLPLADQKRVTSVIRQRSLTNHDIHLIWQQIGDDLDFLSGHDVAQAFLAVWAEEFPDQIAALIDTISDVLPWQVHA
ncbi:ATP-dependent nuclease [Nocardia sp. JW2]|uniref:ATP-dependent nuclease n=1 Tax=Nocardia sp. JW2 TaxID=3450738 RepID=UPI003F41E9D3